MAGETVRNTEPAFRGGRWWCPKCDTIWPEYANGCPKDCGCGLVQMDRGPIEPATEPVGEHANDKGKPDGAVDFYS